MKEMKTVGRAITLVIAVMLARFSWDVLGSAFVNWYRTAIKPWLFPWWMNVVYKPVANRCNVFAGMSWNERADMLSPALGPLRAFVFTVVILAVILGVCAVLAKLFWFVWTHGGVSRSVKAVNKAVKKRVDRTLLFWERVGLYVLKRFKKAWNSQ